MDDNSKASIAKQTIAILAFFVFMRIAYNRISNDNRYIGHSYSDIIKTLRSIQPYPKVEYWQTPIGVGDDGEFIFANNEEEFNAVYNGNPYEPRGSGSDYEKPKRKLNRISAMLAMLAQINQDLQDLVNSI